MANQHGDFIWYELLTPDADSARAFYEAVVGWTIEAQASGDVGYRIISAGDGPIAGLMPLTEAMAAGGARPAWLGYIGVDDVDAMATLIKEGNGTIHVPPTDIPGVRRFALVADPSGAPFYVMRGFSGQESHAFSYDRPRPGHCAWNELATADPAAAMEFYGQRFGWVKDGEMDMGPLGSYEFLRHAGRAPVGSPPGHGMVGAVMPKPPRMPVSAWTYYFRVPNIEAAAARIDANGGTVVQPPTEIPGGDFSMVATDPQSATFALVGGKGKAA